MVRFLQHNFVRDAIKTFATLAVLGVLFVYGSITILAAPPTSNYAPNETSSPSCSPGDAFCAVSFGWTVDTVNNYVYNITDAIFFGGATPALSDIVLNQDGSAVFNEQGGAVDFRIEGDTDTELLFVDGSADKIGISTTSPTHTLTLASPVADVFSFSGDTASGKTVKFIADDDLLGFGIDGVGLTYQSSTTEFSGFNAGNYTSVGGTDHQAGLGYYNLATGADANITLKETPSFALDIDNASIDLELDGDLTNGFVFGGVDTSTTKTLTVNDSAGAEKFSVTNAGVVTINGAYSLPTADGSANQVLITDGAGALSFTADSTLVGTTDSDETSLGVDAGGSLTTGTNLTAVGNGAGAAVTEGNLNDFFGVGAGATLTTGSFNTLLGNLSGQVLTTENGNTIIGSGAGDALTGADSIVVIGKNAVGGTSPTGGTSVVIGADSAAEMSGSGNVLIGHQVASGITSGGQNVIIGTSAGGSALTTGSNNVFIGDQAGDATNVSSSIAIGDGADPTASDQALIGGANTSVTDVYLGAGVTNVTPSNLTLQVTGGSGTDVAGADLIIASGKATGNAVSGDLSFQTGDAGASGTTLQSLTEKMRIEADGGVFMTALASNTGGAGYDALCLNASTEEITVNTNGDDCVVSSARFKNNIQSLDLGLDFINQVIPRSFTYNSDGSRRIGFIAEEVAKLDQRLVFYESDQKTVRGVNYQDFSAILAKAVQELDQKVKNLTAQLVDFLADTVVAIKGVVTERLTVGSSEKPTGITLYDTETSEPYCLHIADGDVETKEGVCEEIE